MRVTDLDKFSLEEIWRPYRTAAGFPEGRFNAPPLDLEHTARLLAQESLWSAMVLDRLARIGVSFPDYIQHPLVDVVRVALIASPNAKGETHE